MSDDINNMRRKLLSAHLNAEEITRFNVDDHRIEVDLFESRIHRLIARAIEVFTQDKKKYTPLLILNYLKSKVDLSESELLEYNTIIEDTQITDDTYKEYEKVIMLEVLKC